MSIVFVADCSDRALGARNLLGLRCLRWRVADNHPQGIAPDTQLDWGLTNVLAIGKDFRHRFSPNADARGPKILHFFHADVPAAINYTKQAQQPKLVERPHKAEVKQTIVHLRLVRETHSVTILRPVARGDRNPGSSSRVCQRPSISTESVMCGALKASQHLQQSDDVAAMRPQPARLFQRQPIDGSIQTSPSNRRIERGACDLEFGLGQAAQL